MSAALNVLGIWVSRSMRSTTISTVGFLQRRMQAQLLRGEDHQQRLARALEVPDQALLGLAGDDALDDLVRRLVLLVAGDDLDPALLLVGREDREVARGGRARRRGCSIDATACSTCCECRQRPRRRRCATAPTARPAARSSRSGTPCPRSRRRRRSARRARARCARSRRGPGSRRRPSSGSRDRRLRLDHDERDAVDQQHQVGALLGRRRRGR